ncbi:MAG: M56 family metallopeptidase [Acidobacteriota bacterium]|nr:M56 family metallopeptidase [Acidobacteriota bacterium]
MTSILLQIGATKLGLAIVLAGMVWVVQPRVKRPAIVHALWLMVLGVMLVPAVVPLRVLPEVEAVREAVASEYGPLLIANPEVGGEFIAPAGWFMEDAEPLVALVWLLGSAAFFGWTLVRTVRFQRTLTRAARPARQLQRLADEIGDALGLPRVPQVHTTNSRLRPMVWWSGGRVRILIPSMFLSELDETELRAVLAHELAHVRRRDYLVRIVEWLACSAYWWNPFVWWARRELRSAEESSCDVVAVSALKSTRVRYARSLLRVVEVMSSAPVVRTPALASAADGGRDSRQLEKRLRTILAAAPVSDKPGWLCAVRRAALVCGLCAGLVYCDAAERVAAPEVATASEAGEMSPTAKPDALAGARVVEPGLIVFLPGTQRDWFVAWDVARVASGPRPSGLGVQAPPNCYLDPVERNDRDLQWAHDRRDKHIQCMIAWADTMDARGVPRGPNGGCIGFDVVPDRPIWACTSRTPVDIERFVKVGAIGYALRAELPES